MSEGTDQGTSMMQGQQQDQDQLQPHSPAQQQSGEDFNGMGENGTNDLGDFGNIAGGMGTLPDTAGSAAGATSGADLQAEQTDYGSTGQATDQDGAFGRQAGQQLDQDGRELSDDEDDYEDDLGDGSGAAAGAGPPI